MNAISNCAIAFGKLKCDHEMEIMLKTKSCSLLFITINAFIQNLYKNSLSRIKSWHAYDIVTSKQLSAYCQKLPKGTKENNPVWLMLPVNFEIG